MAGVLIPISTTTLSSTASTVTLSSIPQTYTDIMVRVSARFNAAVVISDIYVYTNGSTTSNSDTELATIGSNVYSWRNSYAPSGWYAGSVGGTSSTANTFSSGEIYFPNYTSAAYKVGSIFTVCENNSATQNMVFAGAGLRSNTDAITSITFNSTAHDFVAGSTFTLYGIK